MPAVALWWLRLRHGWRHRFSHKPLCDRFSGDVLRIGPLHVCRSCTLLYAGIATGVARQADDFRRYDEAAFALRSQAALFNSLDPRDGSVIWK